MSDRRHQDSVGPDPAARASDGVPAGGADGTRVPAPPAPPMPSVQRRVKWLTRDSLVYGVGQAGQKLIGLILLPILTRIFDTAEYGAIDLITQITLLASYFVVFGNDTALLRFYHDTDDEARRREVVSLGFGFRLMASIVLAALLLPAAGLLSDLIFETRAYSPYIVVALLNLPFSTVVKFYIDFLRVRLKPVQFVIFSIGNLFLIAALTIWLTPGVARVELPIVGTTVILNGRGMGLLGVFIARLIADVVFTLLGLAWTFRDFLRPRSLAPLREMLHFGLPLVPVGIAQWVLVYADRYVLGHYVSLNQVGVYVVGAKAASFMMLFIAAFQYAWGPFAISIWREPNARATYAKVFSLYVFVAGIVGLLVTGLAREFLGLVTRGHFVHGYRVAGFLVFAAMAYGAFYVPATGLQVVKRTAWMGIAAVAGAVLNLVLNLLLVGPFEAYGVATATLVSQTVATLMLFVVAQRLYPVPYEMKRTGFAYALALALSAVSVYFGRSGAGPAAVATGTTLVVYVAGCMAVGVIRRRDFEVLRNYVRKRLGLVVE
jgi:O-antigen/teichoic acid export membrane protein